MAVEERHRLPRDVTEQILAQLRDDALPRPLQQVGLPVGEDEYDPHEQRDRRPEQIRTIVMPPVPSANP